MNRKLYFNWNENKTTTKDILKKISEGKTRILSNGYEQTTGTYSVITV